LSLMDDKITYGKNEIISSQYFPSIGHWWQKTKSCELLVVTSMIIKWLLFKMTFQQWWHDFSMQLSSDYILNMIIDVWMNND